MKKSLFKSLGLTMIPLFFLSACGQITTTDPNLPESEREATQTSEAIEAQSQPRDYLSLNTPATLQTINPTKIMTTEEIKTSRLLNEGLYRVNQAGQLVPGLIEGEPIQVDERTIQFAIRPDARWEDAEPVKAEDFVMAWQNLVDPSQDNHFGGLLNGTIENATEIQAGNLVPNQLGVRVAENGNLEITLEDSLDSYDQLSRLLAFPALSPLPSHHLKTVPIENYGERSVNFLSNGPFTIENWNSHWETWTYQKNYEYWNQDHYPADNISVQVNSENDLVQSSYEAQLIDIAQYTSLDNQDSQADQAYYLEMNPYRPDLNLETPLADKRIRQVFDLAYDPNLLAQKLPEGQTAGLKADEDQAEDLDQAQALIDDYLAEKGYQSLELEILHSDRQVDVLLAEAIQEEINNQLDGLVVNLKENQASQVKELAEDQAYDILLVQQNNYYDLSMVYNIYSLAQAIQPGDQAQPDQEVSFAKTIEETDIDQARKILSDDYYLLPLFQTSSKIEVSGAVSGIESGPANPFFEFYEIGFEAGDLTVPLVSEEEAAEKEVEE